MRRQRGSSGGELIFALLILAVLYPAWCVFANWSCKSKWERSGMTAVTWGPVQGCLINLPDGRWLPEERIREIDIQRIPDTKSGSIPK